jgi:uncharacterized membrane protein
MGWGEFALALWIFFLSHAVPVRPPVRPWAVARLGERGFTFAYSVLSLAVLAWLTLAAGRAPFVPLWMWAPWQNHVVLAVMLPVCLILALAIGRPNPFSFGGVRNDRFDPARPGIVGWMRHPFLVALALWAGAHTLANGDLAHVILFGSFAVFALLGGQLIDRRKRRHMGAEWDRLQAAMTDGRQPSLPEIVGEAPSRIAAGLALYAALLVLHPLLFGVSPIA